jgi:anthranilate synthase component 1
MYEPGYEQFVKCAEKGTLVPVAKEILADMETPVSAFKKISDGAKYAFLLESVVGGERIARYSFLGANPRLVLRSKNRKVQLVDAVGVRDEELADGEDPLHMLKRLLTRYRYNPANENPPFSGGAVGFMGYDIVRFFEHLPEVADDDLGLDDCCMMIADTLVIFDHVKRKVRVECNTLVEDDPRRAYEYAIREIEATIAKLRAPLPPVEPASGDPKELGFTSTVTENEFEASIDKCKEYIAAGDCIQVVLSQRFATPYKAEPFDIYRALRSLNPSPYMFFLKMDDIHLVGASPEVLVTCEGDHARVRPIAGTRPRGKDEAEDKRLEQELLADEKERAEHIMLVDLGRNDIGRIAEYGTVTVSDLMTVERYSHVMHIVSDVRGKLKEGIDAFDVFRACFPAGTVSGAPKVRAMQIIDELEKTRRGTYAGAVGYFGYGGDMDTCITIRTILLKDNIAYIQSGAGIVSDSVPANEYIETTNKAKAAVHAIETAEAGLE